MIRVQLAPENELRNPYWYLTDLIIFVVVGITSFLAAQYFLQRIENERLVVQQMIDDYNQKIQTIQPEIHRYKNLDRDVGSLSQKLSALQAITVSRVSRYFTIIALEHLHVLKPEGLWFIRLEITKDSRFNLKGQAFDNMLLAEYMMAMRDTENAEATSADLRTRVYFKKLKVIKSQIEGKFGGFTEANLSPQASLQNELLLYPKFEFVGDLGEKLETPQQPNQTVSMN